MLLFKEDLLRDLGDTIYHQSDEIEYFDSAYYGRCTILTPSQERIKEGIKKIQLRLKIKAAKIFLHTPGMFLTYPDRAMTYLGQDIRPELNTELGNNKVYT